MRNCFMLFVRQLFVVANVLLSVSVGYGRIHSVWKDETDWGRGAWGEHVLGPPKRGPHFIPGFSSNISVTVGRSVTLPCQVGSLRGRSVSWIRQSDLQVLTTNEIVFTSDYRFKVIAHRLGGVWAWDLVIRDTTEEDDGIYECQINTRPKLSQPILLQVVQAGAIIAGPSEVYVHTGSRLLLTCWVHAPPKPPGPLVWIHNGTALDTLSTRGGFSLHVAVEGPRASARLSILHVTPKDAGNYTCQPEGLDSAIAVVFVLQEEEPAAMHHDNGCPVVAHSNTVLLFILLGISFLISHSNPFFSISQLHSKRLKNDSLTHLDRICNIKTSRSVFGTSKLDRFCCHQPSCSKNINNNATLLLRYNVHNILFHFENRNR